MALAAINVTIGQSLGGGAYSSSVKSNSVPDFSGATTDLSTVSDDVATLVADGASPTQAHVTTLNTDFTAFSASYTSLAASINGDVTVVWDTTVITSIAQLRAAIERALIGARNGIGGLTA